MGVDIGSIIPKKEISFDDLRNKIVVIDAFNTIYQFLATIRQPDGTPLMDRKGNITSHLNGIYYRSLNLMTKGIKLIYVFDGKSPEQKYAEKERREKIKEEARKKYKEAIEAGEIEEAAKYAKQTIRITDEMIKETKKLLDGMGLPYIQAPSEGEAQAAYMTKVRKEIYGVGSQDYDSLLYGATRLILNLTLAKKRKTATGAKVPVNPQLVELDNVLNNLQIDLDRLICLGIIVGTDFNPMGIKGIGPKKALSIVKQFKYPVEIFNYLKKKYVLDFDWKEIFELFKKPEVNKNFDYEFRKPNKEKIIKILCIDHDFSEERVINALEKLEKSEEEKKQENLRKWFE